MKQTKDIEAATIKIAKTFMKKHPKINAVCTLFGEQNFMKRGMQEPHADVFHGSGWRLVQERYDTKWKFLLQRFSSPSGDW